VKPLVSIIIPTYKRAPFLKHALQALKQQTYKNFEVIVVIKPGGDDTDKVLKKYQCDLPLKVIIQHEGFVSRAYNLGLKEAKGEIIAFLDDDSVPYPNWLQKYIDTYSKHSGLGGVSGVALSADIMENGELKQVPEITHLYMRWHEYYYSRWSYNRPISGMSDWWIFFGKDGLVHQRPILEKNSQKAMSSLLLMGANMSVKREAIKGLEIDEDLVLGFSYEQLLAYKIWRRGYKLLHDPNIKVLHIVHKESLGRFFRTRLRAAHREAEYVLSFFILKSSEREISWIPYVLELASLVISRALSARDYGFLISASRIYGLLYGFVVGCSYLISKALGGRFSIRNSLNKFFKM
jgi:glycosyltransferase involved in cell wall biosynthesis